MVTLHLSIFPNLAFHTPSTPNPTLVHRCHCLLLHLLPPHTHLFFTLHRNAWLAEEKCLRHQIDATTEEITHLCGLNENNFSEPYLRQHSGIAAESSTTVRSLLARQRVHRTHSRLQVEQPQVFKCVQQPALGQDSGEVGIDPVQCVVILGEPEALRGTDRRSMQNGVLELHDVHDKQRHTVSWRRVFFIVES
ncbi:hypothetical protein JHK86_006372 [Glycine max]|nr:hypothetical protein JHK86_006372 [Glycine max]